MKKLVKWKGDINMNAFEKICRMPQSTLKTHVGTQLTATHGTVIIEDGFVYAQGKMPVLLVAHLDTVHQTLPYVIHYDTDKDSMSSPYGIGGDDRCGVYMVLEIVKRFNCSVLFCEDEEIGGIGAEKFIETDLAKELKFNYIIEFDRKGSNDAVFYECDNPEFTEFITKEFYKEAYGTFSDISVLAPYLGCAAVNLSCGYYNAHTKDEYVVLSEMANSINAACKILERTTKDDKFEYIESVRSYYKYNNYSYYGWYDNYDMETIYFLIEYTDIKGKTHWYETMAISEAEAVGKFCMDYPRLSYSNIVDVCSDETLYI